MDYLSKTNPCQLGRLILAREAYGAILYVLLFGVEFEVVKERHARKNETSKYLLEKTGSQLPTQKETE